MYEVYNCKKLLKNKLFNISEFIMTVAFKQENVITEVGPESILHAFFSTLTMLLEPDGVGTKFPKLMNGLYQGRLQESDAKQALIEVQRVIEYFKNTSVDRLIWDLDDSTKVPPIDYDSMCDKSSLYSYFRSLSGRNIAAEIVDNIEAQIEFGGDLEIISYRSLADTIR